jgi:hypothetical protein
MASSYWQFKFEYGFFRITPWEEGTRLSYHSTRREDSGSPMGSVRSKPSPLPNRGDEQRPERREYGDDMDLGYFYRPQMAVDDLVGGHVPIRIPDALLKRIPLDIGEWEFVRGEDKV